MKLFNIKGNAATLCHSGQATPLGFGGQAFIEFIIALIVLPLFISGTITIAKIFIVKQRLHQAARHGAFLMATDRVEKNIMENEVRQYFVEGWPKFDTSKIKVKWESVRVGLVKGDKVTVEYNLKIFNLGKLSFWTDTPREDKIFSESVVCGRASF
ncbi:MAG: pilus assembly protein [Elusimicrobia bacterium]|nr:pilus assembly protein [Elusimicrobiota bacterium]